MQTDRTPPRVTIRCEWQGDYRAALTFPDLAAAHAAHGDDLSRCDAWRCDCGNTPAAQGFYPCDPAGALVEPGATLGLWRCDRCGGVVDTRRPQ